MLTLGWLHPSDTRRTPRSSTIYDCGEIPVQQAWFNFNPRFYIVALIFLIFDVKVAFTYPVATVFRRFVARGQGGLAFMPSCLCSSRSWCSAWRTSGDTAISNGSRQARQDTLDKQDETDKPVAKLKCCRRERPPNGSRSNFSSTGAHVR